ncbi:MAG: hypothetical protein EOS18_19790 [Mesorhizobium sp.]|nr:MAG: hypothetical protein EOS18_19790 [Mesorhizobium sp.]
MQSPLPEQTWLDELKNLTAPVTNPLRHVGRNDPCPCGSGKKRRMLSRKLTCCSTADRSLAVSGRSTGLVRSDCAEEDLAEFPEFCDADAVDCGEGIEVARAAFGHID